jgi:hypothetical protein
VVGVGGGGADGTLSAELEWSEQLISNGNHKKITRKENNRESTDILVRTILFQKSFKIHATIKTVYKLDA